MVTSVPHSSQFHGLLIRSSVDKTKRLHMFWIFCKLTPGHTSNLACEKETIYSFLLISLVSMILLLLEKHLSYVYVYTEIFRVWFLFYFFRKVKKGTHQSPSLQTTNHTIPGPDFAPPPSTSNIPHVLRKASLLEGIRIDQTDPTLCLTFPPSPVLLPSPTLLPTQITPFPNWPLSLHLKIFFGFQNFKVFSKILSYF